MKLTHIEQDILLELNKHDMKNQRELATRCNVSLGATNHALKSLFEQGYLDTDNHLSSKAIKDLSKHKVDNAIILAAGCGMRMVPINTMTPKGLLQVHGEALIERLIKQLKSVGIKNIYLVVGFMKESFEYLIDEYDVRLLVNPHYNDKNNLYSLSLCDRIVGNTYIIPSDIYCHSNPFSSYELRSYYVMSDQFTITSPLRITNKNELVFVKDNEEGNRMVGITYLTKKDLEKLFTIVSSMKKQPQYDNVFFEEAFVTKNGYWIQGKKVADHDIIEIDTYEQLLDLDQNSKQLNNTAISIIKDVFDVQSKDIHHIEVLKKGMTNRSFFFEIANNKYIMRIPGEGTDQLINRKEEASVYNIIEQTHIADPLIYINPNNGYKITKYLNDARVANSEDLEDVRKCMSLLKDFHNLKLHATHRFDPFALIDFYESLWNGKPSAYRDYSETKKHVLSLVNYINEHKKEEILCHIDSVPDNFLFCKNKDNEEEEELHLIDWEYAGNQDPDIDIAMFAIYALYEKEQIDQLIDLYYNNACPLEIRKKIYAYIAVCGLLWSNWCEYKRNLGVEFGEYSLKQYRYAKVYYRYFMEL